MKKRIIYLLAVLGTVGFTACGPGQNTGSTDQNPTGTETTTGTTTGTTMGTTGDRADNTTGTNTTGNRSSTTTRERTGTTNNHQDRLGNISGQERYQLREATDFSYENESFRFNPDQRGITITRLKNGQQTPYGTMRSFGNEGFFIITTTTATGDEETSFGKFDNDGNFTMYTYDSDRDDITERNYRTSRPANTTGTGNNNK